MINDESLQQEGGAFIQRTTGRKIFYKSIERIEKEDFTIPFSVVNHISFVITMADI